MAEDERLQSELVEDSRLVREVHVIHPVRHLVVIVRQWGSRISTVDFFDQSIQVSESVGG